MNIYARILVDEARRRGIDVDILDDGRNLYRLSHGGRSETCWESLTGRTSAIAMVLVVDTRLTHDWLEHAGFRVPRQCPLPDHRAVPASRRGAERAAAVDERAARFLADCGRVVVKPAGGEQGRGITVDVREIAGLARAIETARRGGDDVLLEEYVPGRDLRIIVIDHRFVAAIERRPAAVRGDGRSALRALIEERNRRLLETTGGESGIPLDDETARCLGLAGRRWDSVPAEGEEVVVRRTANFHTGGTIRDVTVGVGAALRAVAEEASRALDIPVVGFDFIVPDFGGSDYVIIEANERPGLANHEPQPTAERFIDFLFPSTAGRPRGGEAGRG